MGEGSGKAFYVQLTVSQKNIIAVDFLCFEAHLSRALFGGRF